MAALAVENAIDKPVKCAFVATNPSDMAALREMKPSPNMTIEVPRQVAFRLDDEQLAFARRCAGPGNGWLLEVRFLFHCFRTHSPRTL
jgi:hypothetical protein